MRDTGLLHHLLNIGSMRDLDSHPIRGASWETFVIEDLLRREKLLHPPSQFVLHVSQSSAFDFAKLVHEGPDPDFRGIAGTPGIDPGLLLD